MDPMTPIFVRGEDDPDFPSPADPVYYVLAGNGLFMGRNTVIGNARFRSVVPAPVRCPVLNDVLACRGDIDVVSAD